MRFAVPGCTEANIGFICLEEKLPRSYLRVLDPLSDPRQLSEKVVQAKVS
jgi:hypothetical protein